MLRLANFTLLCGVLGAQRPAWPSTTDGIHNFGLWDLEENNQPDMNRSADELAVHYLNPIAEDIKRLAPRLKVWASPYAVYNWTLHNRTVAREHGQLRSRQVARNAQDGARLNYLELLSNSGMLSLGFGALMLHKCKMGVRVFEI